MKRLVHPLAGWRVCSLAICLALPLMACAPGREFVRDGQQKIDQGQLEEGLLQMEKGISLEPENREYRMLVIRQRETQIGLLLGRADAQRNADRFDDAVALYRRVIGIDPNNTRAQAGLDAVESARRQQQRVDEAQTLLTQGRADEAEQKLQQVLAETPTHAKALSLKQALLDRAGRMAETAQPVLKPSLRKPVSLDFRDANLKSVFDALSRTTGINFVFDREVKPDIKITLSIANLSIEDVIGVLAVTNQLERKTLNENTVLIYPSTLAKQKDYQELAVKTFYLVNADVKAVFTMLKTVLKSKDLYADERLNSLTLRDSIDAIHLAEKLIAAQDLAEPEVLLDVEVLEIKRSRLLEIGIDPPGKFSLLNIVANPSTVVNTAAGPTTVVNNTLTTTQLTLDRLRHIAASSVGIDNPALNLRGENGDTNILANPRIRAKNREKARILIGDRVPVITTTSAANVGVSESVSYLDVGLKLDVEPNVYLDNEVGVKVNLEVSNIVREVRSNSGSLTYQIGTRQATTTLRLKDGETQALAGLISDEDRHSTAGIPGMVDLPVLGRLFSTERNDRTKTEIVLLITPRVVRNLANLSPDRNEHA
ncbi:MAG TPA: secretin N-terminal domain-containing protein, partial [Rhizobacter sp.]|nr:secretin N-terminal domain-containing protein [Rhizobacter sp.]